MSISGPYICIYIYTYVSLWVFQFQIYIINICTHIYQQAKLISVKELWPFHGVTLLDLQYWWHGPLNIQHNGDHDREKNDHNKNGDE